MFVVVTDIQYSILIKKRGLDLWKMAGLDLKSGYELDLQLHKAMWQQFAAEIDKTNSTLKEVAQFMRCRAH